MALENGNLSAADVAAVTGNGNNGFFGGDGSFWIIVLFLFALMGNWGNGNGFGGNGGGYGGVPYVVNDVQSGFDQAAVMSGINGINTGLANAEVSRCNMLYGLTNQLNNIAMNQQNCCCENRAAVADLKYTVATEACADRAAVNDALRDVIDNNNRNTQAIIDKMCQQEIEALRTQNQNLQTQLNLQALAASQNQQTAQILQDNLLQTQALEQYLAPTPRPAYIVQNPNCCGNNYGYACGCGNA